MRKQLELWKDFAVIARFGRAWIIEVNGELRLSGGDHHEQAEALEWASMFLHERHVRVNLPTIKLTPVEEVKLALKECSAKLARARSSSVRRVDRVNLRRCRQSVHIFDIASEASNRF